MNDQQKTNFEATLNPFELRKMREQADQIAREEGLTESSDIDAFRHSYVSAKITEKYGETRARIVGHGNEWLREGVNRLESFGQEGNPKDQWQQDVSNNEYGIEKNHVLDQLNLTKEEKENRLRKELADDVRNGKLQRKPDPDNRRYYGRKEKELSPQESTSLNEKASIIDSFKAHQRGELEQPERAGPVGAYPHTIPEEVKYRLNDMFGKGYGKPRPASLTDYYKSGDQERTIGGRGTVDVKSYTRTDGTKVEAHMRTTPDGDPGNNFKK